MGRRSSVYKLPKSIKTELDQRIIENYDSQLALKRWLDKKGFNISKSALGRYCQKVDFETKRFRSVGISPKTYLKYKKQLERLGYLLTLNFLAENEIRQLKEIDEIKKSILEGS